MYCTEKNETGQKDANNKKNPQFYSKLLKIQALLPIHGLVILAKFHNDRTKNANFLLVL